MASMIGDSGEVALIVHDQTSRTGIDRRDGFVNEMKAKHPNVNIVDIQYGAGDQLKSTDLAKTIIQAHPNLKGFFGANEGSIIGVLNGVKELKEGKIVVIGYDFRPAADRCHQERALKQALSLRTPSVSVTSASSLAVKALRAKRSPRPLTQASTGTTRPTSTPRI